MLEPGSCQGLLVDLPQGLEDICLSGGIDLLEALRIGAPDVTLARVVRQSEINNDSQCSSCDGPCLLEGGAISMGAEHIVDREGDSTNSRRYALLKQAVRVRG